MVRDLIPTQHMPGHVGQLSAKEADRVWLGKDRTGETRGAVCDVGKAGLLPCQQHIGHLATALAGSHLEAHLAQPKCTGQPKLRIQAMSRRPKAATGPVPFNRRHAGLEPAQVQLRVLGM